MIDLGMKKRKKVVLAIKYLICGIGMLIVLYPILFLLMGLNLDLFRRAFNLEESKLLLWYWNSVKVATLSSVIALLVTAAAGFAFSKFRFRGRKKALLFILVIQMFPVKIVGVAVFILLDLFGLYNSHFALAIFHVGVGIPVSTWLLKGYFDTIPDSLLDSAKIDGASKLYIFRKILLPLSKPMIVVVVLFNFILSFNDFLIAEYILRGDERLTLALGLYTREGFEFFVPGAIMAAATVMIIFFILQEFFVDELSINLGKK